MRILHITETHTIEAGGTTTALNQLCLRLSADNSITIVASSMRAVEPPEGVRLVRLGSDEGMGRSWLYKRGLHGMVEEELKSADLVHIHGFWMAPQWYGARLARRLSIPAILSPHGMLAPWLWKGQGTLKRLKKGTYLRLMACPAFEGVSAIHAITPLEKDDIAGYFRGQRIEVIPNAVELNALDREIKGIEAELEPLILFLGRLHPVKGIDNLIKAFAASGLNSRWRLAIAGPEGAPGYERALRDIASREGVESRVDFIGKVSGRRKWELIRKAWVMAVPSHAEVIGMVNLEAAACSTPTITTRSTGLWDWETGGGVLADSIGSLAVALKLACSWGADERAERGRKMRKLIEGRYSMDIVAGIWNGLYRELSGGRASQ